MGHGDERGRSKGGAGRTRKHSESGYGRPVDRGAWTAKTVKQLGQQPAQPPIRQLLGATDAQTAHPATSSTAPAHRPLGSANAETTPARAPAAAADRTKQPDATERVTVQGPVKEQQRDGMSHGGGGLRVGLPELCTEVGALEMPFPAPLAPGGHFLGTRPQCHDVVCGGWHACFDGEAPQAHRAGLVGALCAQHICRGCSKCPSRVPGCSPMVTFTGGGVEVRKCSQVSAIYRNFPAIASCAPPLACPLVPCVFTVQRCCSVRLREVWLWHHSFPGIVPQISRNFPAFFPHFPQFPAIFPHFPQFYCNIPQFPRNFRNFPQFSRISRNSPNFLQFSRNSRNFPAIFRNWI